MNNVVDKFSKVVNAFTVNFDDKIHEMVVSKRLFDQMLQTVFEVSSVQLLPGECEITKFQLMGVTIRKGET